jgi:hypothetical protein
MKREEGKKAGFLLGKFFQNKLAKKSYLLIWRRYPGSQRNTARD